MFRIRESSRLVLLSLLMGISSITPADDETDSASPREIEEIQVIGSLSTKALRRQFNEAQAKVIGMFNDLNTEEEFDIICRKQARIGSQIKRQVCKPRYLRIAQSQRFQDLDGKDTLSELRRKRQRLVKKIDLLSRQDADFRAAVVERKLAEQKLKQAKER